MKKLTTTLLVIAISVCYTMAQNALGNGSNGNLTVANGNTYYVDSIRSAVIESNLLGSSTIKVENADAFSAGDEVLIITMIDSDTNMLTNQVGMYEFNYVIDASGQEIKLNNALKNSYNTQGGQKHQVIKVLNFQDITIDGTLTCFPWNGSSGGVLIFRASGTVQIGATGIITANGKGYRGGWQYGSSHGGGMGGESYFGIGGLGGNYAVDDATSGAAGGGAAHTYFVGKNGFAGGGGGSSSLKPGMGSLTRGGSGGGAAGHAGSGGGGGYGTPGFGGDNYNKEGKAEDGGINQSGNGGVHYTGGGGGGGGSFGFADLAKLYLGTGGGAGGRYNGYAPGLGGNGGGIILISAKTFLNDGNIQSNGNNGGNRGSYCGGGGAGSGGTIYLQAQSLTNNGTISLFGGIGGNGQYGGSKGGNGGEGRVRLDYHVYNNTGTVNSTPYEASFKNISTQQVLNTSNETGPYAVTAYVFDTEGDPITGANLFYRVNGGSYNMLGMTTGDGELYTANIPGQAVNSVIDYYVTATDGTDSYKDPINAPTSYFKFTIKGNPPRNLQAEDLQNTNVKLTWEAPISAESFLDYSVYRSKIKNFTPGVGNRIAQNTAALTFTDTGLEDLQPYYYKTAARYNFGAGDVFVNSAEVSIVPNDTSKITLSGYVYLEGETNFSNIKVKFIPTSPAGQLDSVYTNALGYFSKVIKPGAYDITYEKDNYQTFPTRLNLSIIDDVDLGEETLLYLGTALAGNVSGVLDGIYSLTNDIVIPNGDTLIIMPGSEIRVLGNYNIYVYGYLEAIGAPGDSILFTSFPANQNYGKGQWQGIDFYDASNDNSHINYAIIQYAVDGVWWSNASAGISNSRIHHCSDMGLEQRENSGGGPITNVEIHNCTNHGLYAWRANPTVNGIYSHHNAGYGIYYDVDADGSIKNGEFANNSFGMYMYNSCNVTFDSCVFRDNSVSGLRVEYYSTVNMDHCQFLNNAHYGFVVNENHNNWTTIELKNCLAEGNSRTGLYIESHVQAHSRIYNSIIRNNGENGIYSNNNSYVQIYNNVIHNNASNGILMGNGDWNYPYIHHNIIAYNGNDGVHKNRRGIPTIEYNTIYGNQGDGIQIDDNNDPEYINANIIVNNNGMGVRANAYITEFQYNNVFANSAGELSGHPANYPPDTWTFLSTNINGAPADNYLNFSAEPELEFSNVLDFTLQANSVCRNAGDNSVLDPDGTAKDIGALYLDYGNPHKLSVAAYSNNTVSLNWTPSLADTLLNYKVYYKLSTAPTYTFFQATADTSINVNGLTNNQLYDFVISSVFPSSESPYSLKVSEKPGSPQITLNPVAMNLTITTDTLVQALNVSNTGSRDLQVNLAYGVKDGYSYYDGSGDYFSYGDISHYEGLTAFTIETWVKRENNGHFEMMGKNYRSYSMFISSANRFGIYKGYNGSLDHYQSWTTPYVLPINEWHHLAVTWQGNIVKFYVDGDLIAEYDNAMPDPIPNETYQFEIGRRAGESQYLKGGMSEVRLWNKVRTADEIKYNMNSPLLGNEIGLIGYWPMHTDYNDHSVFAITGVPHNQSKIVTTSGPGYKELPLVMDKTSVLLAPGANEDVTFKFPNTGQEGTFVYTTPIRTNVTGSEHIDYELSLTYGTEIPSTPVYFTPVAETGKPYEVVITAAEIDGVSIQVGDEIAIFDDTLCVGAAIFDGSFNMVITAWEKDIPTLKDGFTPGNNMTFVVYDNSADLEAAVETTDYYIGDGTFGYGSFSSLSLTSTIYKIQNIPLVENTFNLISFNRLPRTPAASAIFDEIESLKIAYNDEGWAYIPEYGINSIGDINFRDAFYVYSTVKDTFYYEGSSINPLEWDIKVEAGKWNYVSYLGEMPVDITLAIPDSTKDSIDVIQNAAGQMYVPSLAVNTIGTMKPGVGYQVVLSSPNDVVFNYQIDNGFNKSVGYKGNSIQPEYYAVQPTGLPYNIIIENPTVNDYALSYGDEIAAYYNGQVVGAVVFTGAERTVLTTWEGDEVYNLSGFKPDENIEIRIYRKSSQEELSAELVSLNENANNLVYKGENYSYLSLTSTEEINEPLVVDNTSLTVKTYPNPFTHSVQFSTMLDVSSDVTISITNILGQVVDVVQLENQAAGNFEYNWSGSNLNTGVYNYSIETNSFKHTGTIIKIQ